jgi:hypothetical protein
MKFPPSIRTAGWVLAAVVAAPCAMAQSHPTPAVMTDTAPLPATERASTGAIILMDEPVLAQREQMQAAQERSAVDTRAMGAGPANLLQRLQLQQNTEDRPSNEADRDKAAPR